MDLKKEVANHLLEIGAVQIRTDDYFTWTSGIKSPIYCDNRLTMSYPTIRAKIAQAFVDRVKEFGWQPDVIAGCATAGIPHAAWLADLLELPMVYVRSSPKGHGKGNQIEGRIEAGQKVIVIEDLISTGGSSIESAKVLREAGLDVLGVLAIFTYGLNKAKKNFDDENIVHETITGYDHLLDILASSQQITTAEKTELEAWRNQL